MPSQSSPASPQSGARRPAASSSHRTAGIVGAVVGAVVGGVLGAVAVKKYREKQPRIVMPAKVTAMGNRALASAKRIAHDAKLAAKSTVTVAAGLALAEAKSAAQQFMTDVASGKDSAHEPVPVQTEPAASEKAAPRKSSASTGRERNWTKPAAKAPATAKPKKRRAPAKSANP